ncbi:MAG: hypothetical protein K1X67_25800 [Fimbriimonadaceae bacterium]|nr:hypothetical protein [Fimbriimonadaceae bacterium]
MEPCCPTHDEALAELERLAPGAPLLALGQTVFWDEPMKAGVALAAQKFGRKFVTGVHDTDYFGKLHLGRGQRGFRALPHNDTTTKDLWSAAGEFSRMFGSETVVTRDLLQQAGLRLAKVTRDRPGILDEYTEAWGWRGLVSLSENTRIIAETPLGPLFNELNDTFQWALDASLASVAGNHREDQVAMAEQLRSLVCDASEPRESQTLSTYYRRIIPGMLDLVAGEHVDAEVTATTELLRFNTDTWQLPRFELFGLFVDHQTREHAKQAYNDSVRGSEIYTLDRFGSWAIPFDLVVPGHGRGTLRIAPKAIIIMTPKPLFITTKKTVANLAELAVAIEGKFGSNCTVVGKAVTLIGMMAREFVFVFHEGASGYVWRSRNLHQKLAPIWDVPIHPILRVKYEPWDAMKECCAWLELPEPFRQPFGVDELCAPSFAQRWREVIEEQKALLVTLSEHRRALDFIRFLSQRFGQSWHNLAREYESLHDRLEQLDRDLGAIREDKAVAAEEIREQKRNRVAAERAKGEHWRAKIFEKEPTAADFEERKRLTQAVETAIHAVAEAKRRWRDLQAQQDALVAADEVQNAHRRRRNIELEAELKRLKLARQAIVTSQGLEKSGHRPAAWWFALVCPGGSWFRETVASARYYLEPLR